MILNRNYNDIYSQFLQTHIYTSHNIRVLVLVLSADAEAPKEGLYHCITVVPSLEQDTETLGDGKFELVKKSKVRAPCRYSDQQDGCIPLYIHE